MQFTRINAIGIELEGIWQRFGDSKCEHDCDSDCCSHHCSDTDYDESGSCWELNCDHDDDCTCSCSCEIEDCEGCDCDHDHNRRCYYQDCQHYCDSDCCSHECDSDCRRVPHPLSKYWHEDGSVESRGESGCVGELASPIFYDISAAEFWVNKFHPDVVNSTCGTHVHVSTKNDDDLLEILSQKPFYDYFLEFVNEWAADHIPNTEHYFYKRLNGGNDFCCPNFRLCRHHNFMHCPDDQLNPRAYRPQRYAHLNFMAYREHGTLEFRVFHGMKTPSLIISAVMCIVECIESYLAGYRTLADYRSDQKSIKEFAEQLVKAEFVDTEFGVEELMIVD